MGTPHGTPCVNRKCNKGYTCFRGQCVVPINIGKAYNSKQTNCNTMCVSSWKDDTKICQLECSKEKLFCRTGQYCCNDYFCSNNACVGCNIGTACVILVTAYLAVMENASIMCVMGIRVC